MVAWLKQLSSSEQVALLFVVLFGFLTLLTAGLFLNSLRERESEDERLASQLTWERVRRDLRAAWIGGCMFWVAWISGPLGATLLFALFSFLALREFITLVHTQRSDHRTLIVAFFVLLTVQYMICGTRFFDLFTVFLPAQATSGDAAPVLYYLSGLTCTNMNFIEIFTSFRCQNDCYKGAMARHGAPSPRAMKFGNCPCWKNCTDVGACFRFYWLEKNRNRV